MAEDKSGLYITTIVGVVAVLALVLLYLNGSGLGSSDSATGMATVYGERDTTRATASCSDNGLVATGLLPGAKNRVPYRDACYRAVDSRFAQAGFQEINFKDFSNAFVKAKHCDGGQCYLMDWSCDADGVHIVKELRQVDDCTDGKDRTETRGYQAVGEVGYG